jgi:hypothetical protein
VSPEEDALRRIIEILQHTGVPYMLTGSVATSFHGRPRTTHDADIVIDPIPSELDALLRELDEAGFYVDPDGARDALRRRLQFNAIETQYACKIDLIIRKDRPFSQEEFSRRQPVDLTFCRAVAMVTPEDAILSKLEWARRSGDSERQTDDAASVVELTPHLDRTYIERWAEVLGVPDLWRKIST